MQAVIFDIDGTLVDSVDLHARAWQEAFQHFGYPVEFAAVRAQIGKGGDQLMPEFLSKDELAAQGAELEAYRSQHYKTHYFDQVRAFPQVRELFQRLRQDGWRLGLASSAKGDELERYKEICQISDLIDAETSSDDAEKSKPHPDIFQAAVGQLGLSPADCLIVGDSPYDATAARRAGVAALGVLCGGFPRAELEAAGFITLYEDPAQLLAQYDRSLFATQRPRGR